MSNYYFYVAFERDPLSDMPFPHAFIAFDTYEKCAEFANDEMISKDIRAFRLVDSNYSFDSLDNLRNYVNNDFFELVNDSSTTLYNRLNELFRMLFYAGIANVDTLNDAHVYFPSFEAEHTMK